MKSHLLGIQLRFNAFVLTAIAAYFFLIPFSLLVRDIHHPSLASGEIPDFTYRWHRSLSADIHHWAQKRTTSGAAATMDVMDISGTEWPMFSAVFYLWTTESLHDASLREATSFDRSPLSYSLPAIEAATSLIVDPNNAAWVKRHWGDDYLARENIFYRMLLISGLVSYQSLTGNKQHQDLLSQQVESLASELENSPHGLLDDYPGQCYPIDVLPAIATIKRADRLLGIDRSEFIKRSIRGFSGELLDPNTQLPAYIADSKRGVREGPARGIGASYMLIWAPELWPDVAAEWYNHFDKHFWQQNTFTASVREFSRHSRYPDWFIDVDAGPVFAGIGTAASAFGIGAERANGRADKAYLLGTQAMVAAWPLPDGKLLVPRLLSNLSDAPHVGEAALLFSMTRTSIQKPSVKAKSLPPLSVYLTLLVYLLLGLILLREAYQRIAGSHSMKNNGKYRFLYTQFFLWSALLAGAALLFVFGKPLTAACILFLASIFPRLAS